MTPAHYTTRRSALTLIEVMASTMIVAMLAVATLDSLGAATRSAEVEVRLLGRTRAVRDHDSGARWLVRQEQRVG